MLYDSLRPLRISVVSALKCLLNAEDAEIRRGPQRQRKIFEGIQTADFLKCRGRNVQLGFW